MPAGMGNFAVGSEKTMIQIRSLFIYVCMYVMDSVMFLAPEASSIGAFQQKFAHEIEGFQENSRTGRAGRYDRFRWLQGCDVKIETVRPAGRG